MEDLVRKYEHVTVDHIKLVDRNKHQLKSDIVGAVLEPGHCDLYIDCSDTDILTELGANVEAVAVKHERRDSVLVDADHTRHVPITSEDNDVDLQTDLQTVFGNAIVKTEQNFYEDYLDIKSEIVNEYDYCIDYKNLDVPNDGYLSDSTLVLDTKPIPEELLDKTQSCLESTQNLGMTPDTNVTQMNIGHVKEQNNYKTETDTKLDKKSIKRKKKLQDQLEFETAKNLTLCDEISELNLINTEEVSRHETRIKMDESSNFWGTNEEGNNLLVKRDTKKDLVNLKKNAASPYSCTVCDYKCRLKISMAVHMRGHKDNKYFTCEFCNYKCKLRHSLNLHMQKHRNIRVNCDLCDSKFNNSDDLYSHKKIHVEENSFACDLCEYETGDSVSFEQHMGTHTEVRIKTQFE
nr:RE1-silencing transcription factor-like [Maniola hyperantus]